MNKQIDNKENIVFIMILRIVAAFAVIIIHTKTLTNFDTKGYYFLHCCILWCVPLFFMISGYIFLGIKTYLTYKHVTKNIVKFFYALFTIGWFYAFIQRVFENGISVYTFVNSFIDVIKGNLWAHMWYVYSIIGIYLVLPVCIQANFRDTQARRLNEGLYPCCLCLFLLYCQFVPHGYDINLSHPYLLYMA